MKTKAFGIFAAVLIIVGALLGVIGMNKLNWKFSALDTRVFEEKFYEYAGAAPLKSIELDTNFSVNVVKGDKLTLKYYVSEENLVTLTEGTNGEVTVKGTSNYKFSFNFFRFKEAQSKYELTVPDGIDVIIDGTNADINAENIAFKKLSLDTRNIDVNLKNCTAQSIEVESTNTDIRFENVTADSLTIDSVNLDIKLKDCVIGDIKTEANNTTFNDCTITANSIFTDAVNLTFKVKIKGDKGLYTVKIDTVNGEKRIEERTGTDPSKIITIETINLSGFLEWDRL